MGIEMKRGFLNQKNIVSINVLDDIYLVECFFLDLHQED